MANDKEIAVKTENISKAFNIGKGLTPRDFISQIRNKKQFEGMNDNERIVGKNFWALRDISVEVYRGETLGIIGSNGAGKTTLLKILSKILKQSHGTYTINGRVSSLIGVGTGFHTELTGRENVYFNGALLGMKRSEITKNFEEIVEFAEIGSFIDTPIKYYSSGMRSRLAFSVAMNLDAEIMIIDEALAVGDVAFRKKSTEKMRNTAFTGRTVLFVTHSLSFLQEVCDRSILIDKGRKTAEGPTDEVIDIYMDNQGSAEIGLSWASSSKEKQPTGDEVLQFEKLHLHKNGSASRSKSLQSSDKIEVSIEFRSKEKTNLYSIGYSLYDEANRRIWRSNMINADVTKGKNHIVSQIPTDLLKPGRYVVSLDCEKRGEGWVVNPQSTAAKLEFNLSSEREDILQLKTEGIVKPVSHWHKA